MRKIIFKISLISLLCLVGFTALAYYYVIYRLPANLHLSPGQRLRISVHYPLCFRLPRSEENLLLPTSPYESSTSSSSLILESRQKKEFQVELRLFSKILVKRINVEIAPPLLVIPGGQAIGVLFSSQGVLVVGHLPIKGVDLRTYHPAKEAGLRPGDILLAINNYKINRVDEVEFLLRNIKSAPKPLALTIKRRNLIKVLQIRPVLTYKEGNIKKRCYMLGIFIEDPAAGIGTLTFYDPATRQFAGLGHRIADFAGKKEIPFQKGEIVVAHICEIRHGYPGQPGEKIGLFNYSQKSIGQIERNCRFGVFGSLANNFADLRKLKAIPVAYSSQVKAGPAQIYTVLGGVKVESYQVNIVKVYNQEYPRDKGMIIKVTDPILRKKTGGIIQGMSGSPIVQDGRLVGAVTHVFVNDPTKGYGILAEWMVRELKTLPVLKAS